MNNNKYTKYRLHAKCVEKMKLIAVIYELFLHRSHCDKTRNFVHGELHWKHNMKYAASRRGV